MTKHKGPGKANREGITVMQLADMFPDEAAATAWFEAKVWPNWRHCPRCGCTETRPAAKTAGLPYYCAGCQQVFSVRIGTVLERSKVTLRQWVFAIYLEMTSLKGVSSMKLHRDIGVTQKTAWFMLHRIREAWRSEQAALFSGPVEVDETYIGGKRKNMSKAKRKTLKGRGTVGKAVIVGAKDPGHQSGPRHRGGRHRRPNPARLRRGTRRAGCHRLHGRGQRLPGNAIRPRSRHA